MHRSEYGGWGHVWAAVLLAAGWGLPAAASTITVTDLNGGVTAADLVDELLGANSGLAVSNITVTGSNGAAGIFANGGGLGFDTGVVISSGNVAGIVNDPNTLLSAILSLAGDADLNTLTSGTTFDAFVLEFDIVPTGDKLFFRYRFASEEDFNDTFDDAFGIFVNGTNVALLPDEQRVSVTRIGTGPYYESNVANPLNNAFSGFSIELSAIAPVTPGVTNHVKIAIADLTDNSYDAGAFIQGGSLKSNATPTVANAIANQDAPVDTAFNFQFAANTFNDGDADTLTYTAELNGGGALPAWLSFDGTTRTFSGTPVIGDVGTISVDVTADDGFGGTVTDTFDITVSSNAAPVITQGAGPLPVTMSEDGSPTAWSAPTLAATDADVADTLTWSVLTDPTNGTATVSGTGASPTTFTYTPNANWFGDDSFTVEVSDGTATDTIEVEVEVESVNDAPVFDQTGPLTKSITEDELVIAWTAPTVSATDADNDTITWSVLTDPMHGAATVSGTGASPATFDYEPLPDYHGDDSFTIQISDGNGGTATIEVDVTIIPIGDIPAFGQSEPINVTMSEDGSPTPWIAPTLTATDADGDVITWSLFSDASNGTATVSGTGSSPAVFGYTPNANYSGSDFFAVQIADPDGNFTAISITVTIQAVNDAPVIAQGAATGVTMDKNGDPTAFALTLDASDVENDPLAWSIGLQGVNGTAAVDSGTGAVQAISYTPNADFVGSDSFTVVVDDGNGGTDEITVNVTVEETVSNIPVITLTGGNLTLECHVDSFTEPGFTASDVEDGNLTDSVVIGGDTVDVTTLGTYTITYNVTDSDANAAVQRIRTVTVVDTTAPVITLNGANPLTIEPGVAYADPGATAEDACDDNLPAVTVEADSVDPFSSGEYTVTYRVTDASGNEATATRTVTVPALSLCELQDRIAAQLADFQTEFGAGADLDGDLIPEAFTLALIRRIVCYTDYMYLRASTEATFSLNMETLRGEPAYDQIKPYKELVATLMLATRQLRDEVILLLADNGVVLEGAYYVVTCEGLNCLPQFDKDQYLVLDEKQGLSGFIEPYGPASDLDDDGADNLTEYENAAQTNGGSAYFVFVVLEPRRTGADSACSMLDVDIDGDYDAIDIQLTINAALGIPIAPYLADTDLSGGVDSVDIQKIILNTLEGRSPELQDCLD